MRAAARVDALLVGAGTDPSRVKRGGDLHAVAEEFEGVMLQEMVKAMRATTTADGSEPKDDQMTDHLITEALAGHLAKAGGIGLARYLAPEEAATGADDTLKIQGRVDALGFERHLRFGSEAESKPPAAEDSAAPQMDLR